MDLTELIVLAVAAYLTATLSGIIGMGGGMTLLGIMTLLLPAPLVVPLHGVVQLGSNTTRTAIFLRHVRWSVFLTYAPFLLVGMGAAAAPFAVFGAATSPFASFIALLGSRRNSLVLL